MTTALRSKLEVALGSAVTSLQPISGGDINDAYAAVLRSGERVFVKTRSDAPAGMYAREAEGLAWLAEANALRTPTVRCVHEDFLVLDFVAPASKARDYDEQLGRGLAALHRYGAPSFGLERDNFIANLPQHNQGCARFADFYRARRLEPLAARALQQGALAGRDLTKLERLYAKLDARVPHEAPSRLHGDLWSGNVHVDEAGTPMLIDPAVYGGHREVDLAMLQLFGAPSPRFFAAYDEVYPRQVGHADRVSLFQLYPLLVHVCLFGGSYVTQLRSALDLYL